MTTQTPPRSTLTGEPCTGHAPDRRCIECVRDDEFLYQSLAPATEEAVR